MIPETTDSPVDPWACRAVSDGVRCAYPATDGGFCPFHASGAGR